MIEENDTEFGLRHHDDYGEETELSAPPEFDDFAAEVKLQCESAKMAFTQGVHEGEPFIQIEFPNGREKRIKRFTDLEVMQNLLSFKFESYKFVGEYKAIVDSSKGTIEAEVYSPTGERSAKDILISLFSPKSQKLRISVGLEGRKKPSSRVLKISQDDSLLQVTLETGSTEASTLLAQLPYHYHNESIYLRLSGFNYETQDQALKILETTANAIFFKLHVSTGFALQLVRFPKNVTNNETANFSNLDYSVFLRDQYHPTPMSLYWYAVSAEELPLLQYLAYYQCIEHYFPFYSLGQVKAKVTNFLKEANFSPHNKEDVVKLIKLIPSYSGRGYGDERTQLKATIEACVNTDFLREYIVENKHLDEYLKKKSKKISEYTLPFSDPKADLLEPLMQRIYDVRCKIVHYKADGGDSEAPLLPFSPEVDLLYKDVEIIRYVAQKVLTANSEKFQV